MKEKKPAVIAIGGPTASGKSSLAIMLADRIRAEIINFDSMQVYRGMDIGTAKPEDADRQKVPHHLLDILEPNEPFSVGQFVPLFRKAVNDISKSGKLPIAVGGTGLYLRGALGGLFEGPGRDHELRKEFRELEKGEPGILYGMLQEKDPETARKIMPNDLVRIIRALEVYELTGAPISDLQREHSFSDRPYNAAVYCLTPQERHFIDGSRRGWMG